MSASNKYKNPPVKEAIFGIRFSESISLEDIGKVVQGNYFREKFRGVAEWKANAERKQQVSSAEQAVAAAVKGGGFILHSHDNKRLVQINPTQITFHNLNKYDGWEVMIEELKPLWQFFISHLHKFKIQQLSVRYVNQILLPLPFEKGLEEWITILPMIPRGIGPNLNNFFINLNVPGKTPQCEASITQTLLGTVSQKMNVLIDLTVVKTETLENNSANIWDSYSEIREWKNDLFENCITEKTKILFNND